jgi:hypothetical protein
MADALLGRRVRCFGCSHSFIATPERTFSPPRPEPPPPERPPDVDWPRLTGAEADEGRLPFCPGCGRRIPWEVLRCPLCGEELEAEGPARRLQWRLSQVPRRDYEPHRGRLIANLGNASLILGGLSLCVCGTGAALSVPLGIAAWVMANHDLERMRLGLMDPQGRAQTEGGRAGGVAGTILGLLFAAFFAVLFVRF